MFDRVLSLDGDIMITPDARNIFEMYPEEDTLYAYHENDSNDHMDRSKYIAEVHGDLDWPTMSNECKQYFNAGVMLWSKGCFKDPKDIETFADSVWQVPKKQNTFYFGEQTALNYAVVKNNIKFSSISHSFNRMDLGNFDPSCDRYTADFIHYAGPCKYALPGESKRDCMERDYKALYDKK
jgi:lipopolysaccharide biosynthesis glycosyltransferase